MSFNILDELVKDTIWNTNKNTMTITDSSESSDNNDSIFIVNYDENASGYPLDKTFAQIDEARIKGKYVFIPQLGAFVNSSINIAVDAPTIYFNAYHINPYNNTLQQYLYIITSNNDWKSSMFVYALTPEVS